MLFLGLYLLCNERIIIFKMSDELFDFAVIVVGYSGLSLTI